MTPSKPLTLIHLSFVLLCFVLSNAAAAFTDGDYQYALTTNAYAPFDDWALAARQEFGSTAEVVDWNTIKAKFGDSVDHLKSFLDGIGYTNRMQGGGRGITWNGSQRWSGSRSYGIDRAEGIVPGGYLVHDQILNNWALLGSWPANRNLIVRIPLLVAQTPVAVIDIDKSNFPNGYPDQDQLITFDGSKSTGDNLTYSWDFGDGFSDSGQKVSHAFTKPGQFVVTLTVTDSHGVASKAATDPVATPEAGGCCRILTLAPSYPGLSLNGSSLTIQLNVGDNIGKNADWWFVALTPWGHWFSYVYPNHWNDIGTDLSRVSHAYQGPLADISSLVLFDTTGIPSGNYVFYFGVDTNMNGVLDYNQLYYSSLPITINNASYPGIYSGTFTGGDSGTFNTTVSATGAMTGTIYSNMDHTSYSSTGQVLANGSLTMVVGSGTSSSGATFNGNINLINGNVSGSWTNSYYGISGSFSGTKNK